MGNFVSGEKVWIEGLGNLRNTIRQECIARQIGEHVRTPISVLDVGCGQGTQALRLAANGCSVTGYDQSTELLAQARSEAAAQGVHLTLIQGDIRDLDQATLQDPGTGPDATSQADGLVQSGGTARLDGPARSDGPARLDGPVRPGEIPSAGGQQEFSRFGLVCAHGLLMYVEDRAAFLRTLTNRVGQTGLLSLTFRNGDALAMRPGLRQDWAGALEAFDSDQYRNELGVDARADRLSDIEAELVAVGFEIVNWYGVRVFNDAISPDVMPPAEGLADLLDAEEQAGRRDPYRWMASQTHVIVRRSRY